MKTVFNNILILIPAYNEEGSIQNVIQDLKSCGYNNILVIDDNSVDKTYEIVNKLNVYVVKHLLNRGVGCASATGFEIAKILNPEIVVTFDADGQHDADDIIKLIEPIQKGEVDVVIGSRMLAKSGMPWKRIIYNKIANIATLVIYGFTLSDTQSGLKAFNRKAFNLIDIETSRMEFCSEIIHKLKEKKLKFKEVEVKSIYTDYSLSKGQGLVNGIKTFIRLVLDRLSRR
ncbi:MAG: glycosyltransferase family 2 protein [Elusimicrobia bacterium]|nr:glycosyltransferase family 2 protein [Elusimicrobiota bacterium]